MTLVLSRSNVLASLDLGACIAAVEGAFLMDAHGRTLPAGVLGTSTDGGGFHVKAAGIVDGRRYYAAKINANFPQNPARYGLPTVQGVISLHDAETGVVLALVDSGSITELRTAAASAVAAKYLARHDARVIAVAGCGVQARSHVRALSKVRPIAHVFAYDVDGAVASRFVEQMRGELACAFAAVDDFEAAAASADIIVTCTPAKRPILSREVVRAGAFVAAVGADSADKQELDPALLAGNKVVVDVLEQCAAFGDLRHAIDAGLMARTDVHATLTDVVAGRRPGREVDSEVTIFDSTGTGLEDVAAAAAAYTRAEAIGLGTSIRLEA